MENSRKLSTKRQRGSKDSTFQKAERQRGREEERFNFSKERVLQNLQRQRGSKDSNFQKAERQRGRETERFNFSKERVFSGRLQNTALYLTSDTFHVSYLNLHEWVPYQGDTHKSRSVKKNLGGKPGELGDKPGSLEAWSTIFLRGHRLVIQMFNMGPLPG